MSSVESANVGDCDDANTCLTSNAAVYILIDISFLENTIYSSSFLSSGTKIQL